MQLPDAPKADPDLPAAQIRVTSEELTAALVALEASKQEALRRQEEEARLLAATIPIGQAVKDLSLDATPEEIWAEVQAQRGAEDRREEGYSCPERTRETVEDVPEAVEPAPYNQFYHGTQWMHQSPFPWKGLAAVVALALGIPTVVGLMQSASPQSSVFPQGIAPPSSVIMSQGTNSNPFNRIARVMDDEFYRKLRLCQGPNPAYHLMHVEAMYPYDGGLQSAETIYPMRAVPDGYSIFNDRLSGIPVIDAFTQGEVVFRNASDPTFTSESANHIITTRYDGTRYVRCWVAQKDVNALKHHRSVPLYFCQTGPGIPDDVKLIPITIRLFRWERGQLVENFWLRNAMLTTDAPNRFILPEGQPIGLDKHAWEAFPGMTFPPYAPPEWAKTPGVFNDSPAFPPGPGDFQIMQEYGWFDASSSLERIQDVPNEHPFHGGVETVSRLARQPMQGIYGSPSEAVELVDVRPQLDRPYTFVKHDGNVYLRGWTTERLTEEQVRDHIISVGASPDAPSFVHPPVQIQLCLNTCTVSSGAAPPSGMYGPSGGQVIASDIHLDKYAWEKW